MVRLTQLRIPVANTLPGRCESTSNTNTSARLSSWSQAAPRPCALSHSCTCCGDFFDMDSATLDWDPTDTYRRRPSAENAISRVECPPLEVVSCGTTTSGAPLAFTSPFLNAKRMMRLFSAMYSHFGSCALG